MQLIYTYEDGTVETHRIADGTDIVDAMDDEQPDRPWAEIDSVVLVPDGVPA